LEITKEYTKHFGSGTKQNVGSKRITKKEQERQYIEWRRSKILELKAQGYTTERELASKLNVSDSTIHSDFVFLREQARENFNTHIQDRLPSEYERCIAGMNQVLKMSWDIANGSNGPENITTTEVDNKTRLQALALVNDCYKYIMDLTTNGVVITDAIKYVQGKMDHLNKTEKALLQDVKVEKNEEPDEESAEGKTTNGVF
jgi:hypothetical protein